MMIEQYLLEKMARQFRDVQDRPDDAYRAIFVRSATKVPIWGPTIPALEVVDSFQ